MDSRSNEAPKHTPGPWSYAINGKERIPGYPPITIYKADKTDIISQTDDGYYDYVAISEADARLIAAAPEMLEALKRMLCHAVYNSEYNKWTIEMSDFVLQHNKELIAKAEGWQV